MAAKAAPHFPFRRVFSACFWKCVCVFLLCCVLVKWASASLCRLCAVVFLPLCRGCGPPAGASRSCHSRTCALTCTLALCPPFCRALCDV